MSETNYTSKPYAMGDRPADLQNFNPQRDVKIIPHKSGGGETYLFPSDPETDVSHETNKLPIEMWQDYGNDNAGQVARAARMYERALDSTNRSMVAPEWWQITSAVFVGAAVGFGVSLPIKMLCGKLNIDPHIAEHIGHTAMAAGLLGGIHAAEKITAPKHAHTTSPETAEMVSQARNQARKSYIEAFTQEQISSVGNNIAPLSRVSSAEKGERLEAPQQMQIAGIS